MSIIDKILNADVMGLLAHHPFVSKETGMAIEAFQEVLFPQVPDSIQTQIAFSYCMAYRQEVIGSQANKLDRIVDKYSLLKSYILNIPSKSGIAYSVESWVAAFWKICHQFRDTKAELVFIMFNQEICDRLQAGPCNVPSMLRVYACQHGAWSPLKGTSLWKGQQVLVRAVEFSIESKLYTAIDMQWDRALKQKGFHRLGLVGGTCNIPHQFQASMRIFSTHWTKGNRQATSSVSLFALSCSDRFINDLLH